MSLQIHFNVSDMPLMCSSLNSLLNLSQHLPGSSLIIELNKILDIIIIIITINIIIIIIINPFLHWSDS